MSTITESFVQAELAFASYIDLIPGMTSIDYINALKDGIRGHNTHIGRKPLDKVMN